MLFKFLVPLLTSVLTLVAIELALSIFHPIPYSNEANMYYEADPYTGYRLKPHGVGRFPAGIPASHRFPAAGGLNVCALVVFSIAIVVACTVGVIVGETAFKNSGGLPPPGVNA